MMRVGFVGVIAVCAAVGGFVGSAAGGGLATITNANTGTPYPTVQGAIDTAAAGDAIEISAGSVAEFGILIDLPITIRGAGMAQTTIDAQGFGRVMEIIPPADGVVIEGLTLTGGLESSSSGGGLLVQGSTRVRLFDVRISNNTAAEGGGLAIRGGSPGTPTVFAADRCEIVGNTADDDNGSGTGGGIDIASNDDSRAVLTNTLIADNHSDSEGSALSIMEDSGVHRVDMVNCTIAGNTGGRIVRVLSAGLGSNFSMTNCVVSTAGASVQLADFGSLSRYDYCVFDPAVTVFGVTSGAGNVVGSPAYVNAGSGDYALASGSLGIDAADADAYVGSGAGLLDLANAPRLIDDGATTDTGAGSYGYLDCGAYEFQAAPGSGCDGDANGDGAVDVNDISYVLFRLGNLCP